MIRAECVLRTFRDRPGLTKFGHNLPSWSRSSILQLWQTNQDTRCAIRTHVEHDAALSQVTALEARTTTRTILRLLGCSFGTRRRSLTPAQTHRSHTKRCVTSGQRTRYQDAICRASERVALAVAVWALHLQPPAPHSPNRSGTGRAFHRHVLWPADTCFGIALMLFIGSCHSDHADQRRALHARGLTERSSW